MSTGNRRYTYDEVGGESRSYRRNPASTLAMSRVFRRSATTAGPPSRVLAPSTLRMARCYRRPVNSPGSGTRSDVVRATTSLPLLAPVLPSPAPQLHRIVYNSAILEPANATGILVWVNQITQGENLNQRKGSRITMTGLQMRGAIQLFISGAQPGIYVSYTVVYDRLPYATVSAFPPPVLEIFGAEHSASFQLAESRDRFEILGRYNYFLAPSTYLRTFDVKLAFVRPVSFATETAGSIQAGALYVVIQAQATAPVVTTEFSALCTFVDT